MANEITLSHSLRLVNGNLKDTNESLSQSITQSSQLMWQDTWVVGTSEESKTSFGEITNNGICIMRNLDLSNYVAIGPATGSYFLRLKAGEQFIFRLAPAADIYALANTAPVTLSVKIYSD